MPTSSDLVTDLPADFEVFGQAVDTQMKTNADAATQKATLTTKGDIYAATAASTPARLAVGTNGQVLTADSAESTGMKWATPGGGTDTWTLLNTGGTALTGAATITISGITSSKLLIQVTAASASSLSYIGLRINGDSSTKYPVSRFSNDWASSFTYFNWYNDTDLSSNFILLGRQGNSAGDQVAGFVQINNAASTSYKQFDSVGGATQAGSIAADGRQVVSKGFYTGTSAVTSISAYSTSGNFDNGTIYVYGA